MCVTQDLTKAVREFQQSTGEETLLVVVEDEGQISGIHNVGFEPALGLLVDGRPATVHFFQRLQGFHALQQPPSVLH